MSEPGEDDRLVEEVRQRTKELDRLLVDFGDRLRRMRQRNRELSEEIESFEGDLENLRRWLNRRVDD